MADYSAIIAGTGSFVPERRLTNDELSAMVDTNDEWITQRTGIKERRIAADGETTASLGAMACRRALEAAGLVADEAGVTMRAENTIELSEDDAQRMQKLLDVLEDLDDTQEIYHNAAL